MTDLLTPPVTVEVAPFDLSDFLDITRPVDYFALHDAHLNACAAFCGPEFRAAVEALGETQATFLERVIAANYTRITRGEATPPKGTLMDGAQPEGERPIQAAPFLWWTKDNRWR
jgi:hypothetical protein